MSGPVRLLPDALIDQIAAGEVVERPASVVKELVENALDAEATRIRIEVRDGGASLVSVTDNGIGMSQEDARLALQRHATSKLASAADLEAITSFGFRGEALPAIASVSRLRLLTRARGAAEASEIRIENGKLLGERLTGGPEGTRIEVADLFVGVPARRKFLKKAGTEWGHIADWVSRLALALPTVTFELRRDDRAAIVWPACWNPVDRIAAVLGESEAAALVTVECEEATGHLQAFVSPPDRTRANANGIYLFVNGRPVRDKVLRHGLLLAYRDLIPRGRFPSALLFLTVPPSAVDVNVHPAKWEVRFAAPDAVHRLIRRAVRQAMEERSWLGAGSLPAANAEGAPASPPAGPVHREAATPGAGASDAGFARVGPGETTDWIFAREREQWVRDAAPGAAPDPNAAGDRLHFRELRLLGQILASYLAVEGRDGLLLVDQHAAHERVLYERLRGQWLARGVERQGLLLPVNVELDPLEFSALEEEGDLVARLGFEVEPFGEGAVVVRAVPALLAGRDPISLLRGLAEELQSSPGGAGLAAASGDETRLLGAADRIFATLACHSARRAGDHLEGPEQRQILNDLDGIPWAPTCPHGRPVVVSMERAEIERRFSRR
ncbi:MAG: DNA mismatch repair endonuclease MutL [Deltaproteobacteria bacterium]|nr:DNA mismatch repair endonuclease MutL [Deltaproteobacteria bacterium]